MSNEARNIGRVDRVIDRFKGVLREQGYGSCAAHNFFKEHHADPDVLARLVEAVHAWGSAGNHPDSVRKKLQDAAPVGYHVRQIARGVLGETSKVREELEELDDALEQGNRILAFVELSDAYGALQLVAERLGASMDDLSRMAVATRRAFESGRRS